MAEENVLILGAGKYYRPCLQSARETRYRILCIDRDPNALGQGAADAFYPVDFSDPEAVLAFAQAHKVRAIIPLNDYGVQTAAYVAARLGLLGISEAAARRVTDKFQMRETWQAAGLPNPAYQLVESLEEAVTVATKIGYPVIFKPANSLGGGSRGVQTAHTSTEVPTAYRFARAAYPQDPRVLVEACVEGIEHSAEVIIIEGEPFVLAMADKVKTPYPYRVDEKVIYPTAISPVQQEQALQTIRAAVKALGLTVGAAHVELCTTSQGPVLFELGARCGGGATAEPIVSYVSGYPYFQQVIRLLAGVTLSPPTLLQPPNPCIYGFFTVENQEATHLKPSPQFIEWELFEREALPPQTQQGADRLGYYIFQGTLADLKQQRLVATA